MRRPCGDTQSQHAGCCERGGVHTRARAAGLSTFINFTFTPHTPWSVRCLESRECREMYSIPNRIRNRNKYQNQCLHDMLVVFRAQHKPATRKGSDEAPRPERSVSCECPRASRRAEPRLFGVLGFSGVWPQARAVTRIREALRRGDGRGRRGAWRPARAPLSRTGKRRSRPAESACHLRHRG